MKRLLFVLIATALLVAPSLAQTREDITIPQFRQVLVDLGSWVDAQKGTDYARQFQAIDDDTLIKLYPAVPSGRKFQSLVAQLRRHKFNAARSRTQARATFSGAGPLVATPACGAPNTIIENGGACTPAYPDPTDGAWQIMVGPLEGYTDLNGVPAFSPNDNADVSLQGCSLDAETVLQQINVILSAVVNVASPICNIIPAPFNAICWGPVAAIEAVNSVFGGFFLDCLEQDGLVNAAKIDAGFQNTATIYAALGSSSSATLVQDISNSTTTLGADISALDTHLSNVDNHVTAEFGTLTVQLQADYTVLTNQLTALAGQLTQGTALLDATLKQVMKLQLEPSGLTRIVPAILTCTGTDCPNVLNKCPAAGCSWSNVGPLP
jgi:hypothetical protein